MVVDEDSTSVVAVVEDGVCLSAMRDVDERVLTRHGVTTPGSRPAKQVNDPDPQRRLPERPAPVTKLEFGPILRPLPVRIHGGARDT